MSETPSEIPRRHRLEHAALRAVTAFVRRLPQSGATRLGHGIGWLAYQLDRRHRRITLENLAATFPERSQQERQRISREVFAHFGRKLVELLWFTGLTPERQLELVEFVGAEHLEAGLAQGRGVLIVTGHFGFWELHALAHGLRLGPMAVVARALDNTLLDRMLTDLRSSTGNVVIDRKGGLRRIMRALNANQSVAVLIDQHILTADAVKVDFMGRPAATTSAVAVLALRTGAAVIPAFSLPLNDGRYRLIYERPLALPSEESPEAVRDLTQRCTKVLEKYVRAHPERWLWMHRRWRDDVRTTESPSLSVDDASGDADA
ncbi:MAG TPA: lysophospholipid acyltransferase family protein [Luteitalea sp.]|nr:lysophospholipid acyltransferase family protein [Luteitalea sp.]